MTRYYIAKNMDRADITWTKEGWTLNCRNLFTGIWLTLTYETEEMAIAGLKATGKQWREIA